MDGWRYIYIYIYIYDKWVVDRYIENEGEHEAVRCEKVDRLKIFRFPKAWEFNHEVSCQLTKT